MIYRCKANEIPHLSCLTHILQIRYGFKLILKILNTIKNSSERNLQIFSQPFLGMVQMIYRWLGVEIPQLLHIYGFCKFLAD